MGPPGEWQMRQRNANDADLLSFSAVYAAIQIISGDAAKLPVVFYDVSADGTKTINATYPANALMRKPNNYQTRMQFMQAVLLSYLTTGNTYIYKVFDNRYMVKALHVLDPRSVWPLVAEDGSIYYRIGPTNLLAGITETKIVPAREIGHIRLQFSASFPLIGVSPVYAAAASSATGQRILHNAQKFFGNAARPGGYLTAPQRIDDDAARRIKDDFDGNFSGERVGKTAVLGNGLEWKQLSMSAIDSQLIEQLRWSVEDVARVFRVPPFLIGDTGKTTYRNSEASARAYLNGCLDYHLSGIVSEFNSMLELGATMSMEFDLDFLLRTEIDLRYTAYGQAINAGWMRINEVRKKEGLPPDEYGDDLIAQGAMKTLETIVEGIVEPATVEPPDPAEAPAPAATPAPTDPAEPATVEDAFARAYRGVYNPGPYLRGQVVTYNGSLWLAVKNTGQTPGASGGAEPGWRLIVKRGSDGKTGKTPALTMDAKGLIWSQVEGEAAVQVGDVRGLFQEAVQAALRDAKVIP